jgi:alkylation response protein AidB-like acyl-CoA dehydrogenase
MPAAATLDDDEREAFPERAYAELTAWRLTRFFVPADAGGALTSFEEALMLLRVISRRDLTCAIALGQTYLGAVAVWLAGNANQRLRTAAMIDAGDAFALALTEREHGSDVLANEVQAETAPGGFRLTGAKWLINNGTRARGLTVFARTGAPGPRGYSLFFVDVGALPAEQYEHAPKIRTHGIRGADISGIRFRSASVSSSALIGSVGGGFELALKGLMVTRMMCAGFALGAADTALRLALRFAAQRRLYGNPVAALPDPQRTLAECFADMLSADVLALSAVRGAHVDPRSLSIRSAIVKFAVPALVESIVDACATLLGARSYLRAMLPWSLFQKLTRDVRVVGLFDGSSGVNLHVIATQLPALARRLAESSGPDLECAARLQVIFDACTALPAFDGSRIELSARGSDAVMIAFAEAVRRLGVSAHAERANSPALQCAAQTAAALVAAARELCSEVAAFRTQAERVSSAAFACARRYCYLHAAAALVHKYLAAREGRYPLTPAVFAIALSRLAARAGVAQRSLPHTLYAEAAEVAARCDRSQMLFSTLPVRIADASPAPGKMHEAIGV